MSTPIIQIIDVKKSGDTYMVSYDSNSFNTETSVTMQISEERLLEHVSDNFPNTCHSDAEYLADNEIHVIHSYIQANS